MEKEGILDRIRLLATKQGMTVAEVERKADIGNGVAARWNRSTPTADKLQQVANVLGTTMEYLLLGEEDVNHNPKVKILAREANNLSDSQLDLIRSMIKEFEKQNKE